MQTNAMSKTLEEAHFLEAVVKIENVYEVADSKEWESVECRSEGENNTPYIPGGYVKLSSVYAIVTVAVVMTTVLFITSGIIVYCVTTREHGCSTALSCGRTSSAEDDVTSRSPETIKNVTGEHLSKHTWTENAPLVKEPQSKTQGNIYLLLLLFSW